MQSVKEEEEKNYEEVSSQEPLPEQTSACSLDRPALNGDLDVCKTKLLPICINRSKKLLRRRNTAVLVKWLSQHCQTPYPTKAEKRELTHLAGMNMRQLNDWFANARRNIKKLGYEKWKKKHPEFSACCSVKDLMLYPPGSIPGISYPPQVSVPPGMTGTISPHAPAPPPHVPTAYFQSNNHLPVINYSSMHQANLGVHPSPSTGETYPAAIPLSSTGYYPYQFKSISNTSAAYNNNDMIAPSLATGQMENLVHHFNAPRPFMMPHFNSHKNLPPVQPMTHQLGPTSASAPYLNTDGLIGAQPQERLVCDTNGVPVPIQLTNHIKEEPSWTQGIQPHELPKVPCFQAITGTTNSISNVGEMNGVGAGPAGAGGWSGSVIVNGGGSQNSGAGGGGGGGGWELPGDHGGVVGGTGIEIKRELVETSSRGDEGVAKEDCINSNLSRD